MMSRIYNTMTTLDQNPNMTGQQLLAPHLEALDREVNGAIHTLSQQQIQVQQIMQGQLEEMRGQNLFGEAEKVVGEAETVLPQVQTHQQKLQDSLSKAQENLVVQQQAIKKLQHDLDVRVSELEEARRKAISKSAEMVYKLGNDLNRSQNHGSGK